jgi:CRP-like cAMP-binding protein
MNVDETLTLIEKTAFLSSLPVLASVPTEALAQLAAQTREEHYDAGATLFREGEPNSGAYLVVDGMIELRKGRALVRMLGPGQTFGELFSREGAPHAYSAAATRHSHVLNITLENVFDAMLDYPEFGVGMVRVIAKRNYELIERMLELETMLGRFHDQLKKAGIEPADAAPPVPEGVVPGEGPR